MKDPHSNEKDAKDSGKKPLAYERTAPGMTSSGRMVVRKAPGIGGKINIDLFPPICCYCLDPTTLRSRISTCSGIVVTVPLCEGCKRRWKRRRTLLLTIALGLPLGVWLLLFLTTGGGALTKAGMTGLVIGVSAFFLIFLIEFFGYPIRVAIPVRGSNTSEIYFRNAEYTKCLEGYF